MSKSLVLVITKEVIEMMVSERFAKRMVKKCFEFSNEQKQMLVKACTSPWITEEDFKIIANPKFNPGQMREIMRACEELTREQVLQIADSKNSAGKMHEFRIEKRQFERH